MTISILRHRLNTLINPPQDQPISLNRHLFNLAWPSLIENLLQTMLGVVDLIFVGQLGADAIAGIGLGNQIMFMLVIGFFGLAVGNTALVARAIGAKNRPDAERIAKQALILVSLLSVGVAALGYGFGDASIAAMGATPVVTQLGGAFVRITTLFAIFIGIMVVGSGTLRGAGDTRTPMLITGIVNIINIALDYLLIFGNFGAPRLGAIGSAYATTIARGVGTALILYVLLGRGSLLKLDWQREWEIHTATIKRILHIGWPSAVEQILFQLGFLVFSAIVVGLGTDDLAAMQVGFNIQSFSILPAFAFGVAGLTLVGQSLGAKDVARAELVARQSLKSGMVWMVLMGVAFFVWRYQLFGLYTNDANVIQIGGTVMIFLAVMQPFLATSLILGSVLRGGGDTRATMFITWFSVWGVRVGLAYVLGIVLRLGILGVYIGWAADFLTRSTLVYLRYRAGIWKRLKV